jgi:cystathionine beta-lyase/cystathionine gamma-synthase
MKQGKGWSGVLSIELKTQKFAKDLSSCLKLFTNATSFGGADSLIVFFCNLS